MKSLSLALSKGMPEELFIELSSLLIFRPSSIFFIMRFYLTFIVSTLIPMQLIRKLAEMMNRLR